MDNPLDFFDAIYCINLDERVDRWKHCLIEFEKLNLFRFELKIFALSLNISIFVLR